MTFVSHPPCCYETELWREGVILSLCETGQIRLCSQNLEILGFKMLSNFISILLYCYILMVILKSPATQIVKIGQLTKLYVWFAVWCLHDCSCLVIPISYHHALSHSRATNSCQSLGDDYHLLTVRSSEKMKTVQNILKLLNLQNQTHFWTAAYKGLW